MDIFKWLRIPSGEKVQVKAYETWYVRWWSMERTDDGNLGRSTPRAEMFTNQQDAERFANELMTAAKLLQDGRAPYHGKWGPSVERNTNEGV